MRLRRRGHNHVMTVIDEITQRVTRLPADKGGAVLQFVRFLSEQAEEQAWERSFTAAATSPRFAPELAEVAREIADGKSTPLSVDDL